MEAQAIKLSEARSNAELRLYDFQKRIDKAINFNTRKTKVEPLVKTAKELLSAASETHDNVAKARQYIELKDETIGEYRFRRKTSSRGSKTLAISSSQRRREQELAKLQRQEVEREREKEGE